MLVDPSGGSVRANMPASWLAQMAWEVYVLDDVTPDCLTEKGSWKAPLPKLPTTETVDANTLSNWLKTDSNTIAVDFSTYANYVKGHIPGSWYALRSQLSDALTKLPKVDRYVLTSTPAELSKFVVAELQALTEAEVVVLEGGNAAWINAGLDLEKGPSHLASAPLDRYKRLYEGTNVDLAAAGISRLGVWFGRAAEQGRNPSLLGSVSQSSSLLLFS